MHDQLHPLFCIFRPGGLLVPLIPVDELPSWLQVCNWSPNMFQRMQPVSSDCIPREGEYDVLCRHCACSVDSLHQSVSEQNSDSPRSPAGRTKSCPSGFFNATEVAESLPEGLKASLGSPLPAPGPQSYNLIFHGDFGRLFMLNVHEETVTNSAPASAPFQKPMSMPSGSPSMSDPSPEESPNSWQESPKINSSIQASLVNAVARCNLASATASAMLREVENQPIAREPNSAASPVIDEEKEKISAAIATSLCGKSVSESLASERSLTAALRRYEQVREIRKTPGKPLRRPSIPQSVMSKAPSIPQSAISKVSTKSCGSRLSSIHTAHTSASPRPVKIVRRRHRRRRRADKGKFPQPSSAMPTEPQPEQVNSAT